jgi:hypothetical protein
MRMQRSLRVGVAAAALWGAAPGSAGAATITNFGTIIFTGTGTIGPAGSNPAPNNDNSVAASPNAMSAQIFFNLNPLRPLDIEFVVADSGGTTEYFFTDTFTNVNTPPWFGFLFELGFGTGPGFVPVATTAGLDFDTPTRDPVPTSSVFTALAHDPTAIRWTGGRVNPLTGGQGPPFSVMFSFSFDVPDGLAALHPQGLNRFTLRQTAITSAPEPASTALLAAGLAVVALRRRARR